ncbi:MAG: hypothetical protein ACR2PI_11465 [Hyphomicrobiaceae bacterium]
MTPRARDRPPLRSRVFFSAFDDQHERKPKQSDDYRESNLGKRPPIQQSKDLIELCLRVFLQVEIRINVVIMLRVVTVLHALPRIVERYLKPAPEPQDGGRSIMARAAKFRLNLV